MIVGIVIQVTFPFLFQESGTELLTVGCSTIVRTDFDFIG